MLVRLTYFRPTGKFYSQGECEANETIPLHQIWVGVKLMLIKQELPGLVKGHGSDYIVLIDVPEHPYNHPHLVMSC